MPGLCLDATYCIDFLRGLEEARSRAQQLDESRVPLGIPVPAAMQVLLWARRHGETALRNSVELLERLEVLDATFEVAKEASRLGRESERRGSMVAGMDFLIAATARVHHCPLLTRDADFHRIPGLTLESY